MKGAEQTSPVALFTQMKGTWHQLSSGALVRTVQAGSKF